MGECSTVAGGPILVSSALVLVREKDVMSLDPEQLEVARGRITQVFRYLQDLNHLRNPVVRKIQEQPRFLRLADLPDHPAIRRGIVENDRVSAASPDDVPDAAQRGANDFILKVKRPALTSAPKPPSDIFDWLRAGWDDCERTVEINPSKNEERIEGQTIVLHFEDDPRRPRLLEDWRKLRDEWALNERITRAALRIFEELFDLHGQIEREGERLEILAGDGMLRWAQRDGDIDHPVLLQRLQLVFDPRIPEFTLIPTEHSPELYAALLCGIPEVDGKALADARSELEQGGYHPLGSGATSGFLRGLVARLSAHGVFVERADGKDKSDGPRMSRDPVIFIRQRTLGFTAAFDSILKDLVTRDDLPPSLVRLIGIQAAHANDAMETEIQDQGGLGNDEILLCKPYNQDQSAVARRLEQCGSVVVQGPPGTGKTHTIANLIGHLLAQGKTILVTSHSTKALRVLRDQVVPELQPLCVSLLENDTDSRKQLEESVAAIVEGLTSKNPAKLDQEAISLATERRALIRRLADLRSQLLRAREGEYRDIVVAGQAYTPSDAARRVGQGQVDDSWIPGSLEGGVSLPLSVNELNELYQTNTAITLEHEKCLSSALPELTDLMSPMEFASLVREHHGFSGANDRESDVWLFTGGDPILPSGIASLHLRQLLKKLTDAVAVLNATSEESWKLPVVAVGATTQEREPWDELVAQIRSVCEEVLAAQGAVLRYAPALAAGQSPEEQASVLDEIVRHIEAGGTIGWWQRTTNKRWKRVIDGTRAGGAAPREPEHFRALLSIARLELSRRNLLNRWQCQMVPSGGLSCDSLGAQPEQACRHYADRIVELLDWHEKVWSPLLAELTGHGLQWPILLRQSPPNPALHGNLLQLRDAVLNVLPSIITARANALRAMEIEAQLIQLISQLCPDAKSAARPGLVNDLVRAVRQHDSDAYKLAFEKLTDLHERSSVFRRRKEFLDRLSKSAPSWSASIAERRQPHDNVQPPGDAAAAWNWKQLQQELERRAAVSLHELQQQIERVAEQLGRITTDLVYHRAWAFEIRRAAEHRQPLVGWAKMVRDMRGGKGRLVPMLRTAARKLMVQCRTAVPVWIMPLSRVVDTFDPASSYFDVVIIDEASQSGVTNLLALYMGKQILVVGDHEQVSPDAVGQDLGDVQQMIRAHLEGVPNAEIYHPRTSVYDLARTAFGGELALREHFRSVPEIIQFSNHLCYEGRILPLRDDTGLTLKPHTVAYRVEGATTEGKINEVEAVAVASLLVAASEQPEYQKNGDGLPVTFGAISLVGEEQAFRIDELLRDHMDPAEYDRRRVICGNPPHFQGDERDVMFLSVVDVPQEGPLSIRQDERFKQRFNVAASRARDQMWVVHSLQPDIDLKQDDLRRKLIEHAQNPRALTKLLEEGDRKVESEFERQVLRRLLTKGYRVVPQWQAGCFRIDLVVVGTNAKLAIECDGDRYHPPEKLEDDMLRQGILERRGWIFERIRGSIFFRDPDRAMQPVFQRLEAIGIESLGSLPSEITEQDRTELQQRVTRRAEQLRKEWADESHPAIDLLFKEETNNSRSATISKKRTKRIVTATR